MIKNTDKATQTASAQWHYTPSDGDQWLRSAEGKLYRVQVLGKGTNWTKVRFLNTGNVRTVMNFQGKIIKQ